MSATSKCIYCGEPIIWGKSANTGKPIPYNENGRSHFNTCEKYRVRQKPKKKTSIQSLYGLEAFMPDKKESE